MNLRTDIKEKKEYILFILDKSGSMNSCKTQTINGFNEQLQELNKTSDIKTFVSLVEFSSSVEIVFWNKPLEEVEYLNNETYEPNGSTAMLDAVGQAVSKLKNDTHINDDDDVTFLVIIISDGEENSSKEYNWNTVKNIITECKEESWTITYMGSNQDLSEIQKRMNIYSGNTMSYTSTGIGTQTAFCAMATSLGNYRNLRTNNTADDLATSGIIQSFYSSSGTTADTI